MFPYTHLSLLHQIPPSAFLWPSSSNTVICLNTTFQHGTTMKIYKKYNSEREKLLSLAQALHIYEQWRSALTKPSENLGLIHATRTPLGPKVSCDRGVRPCDQQSKLKQCKPSSSSSSSSFFHSGTGTNTYTLRSGSYLSLQDKDR